MIPIDIPQAAYVVDYQGTMTYEQAKAATLKDAMAFAFPGTSSAWHPQSLWIRFRSPNARDFNIVSAPGVGRADVYANADQPIATYGMRVPFAQRSVQRVPPTVHFTNLAPATVIYIHAWLDDESPVSPLFTIEDDASVATQDRELELMSAFALLFIGIFLSLAAANVFVYFFVREIPYVIYSFMMLGNALFAATYVHGSSWRWLWPYASVPHASVQGGVIMIEAIGLLAFMRAFLHTRTLMPRLDRVALWTCSALMLVGFLFSEVFPSGSIASIPGRTIFIICVVSFVLVVFGVGIAALRTKNIEARFFVASNGAVTLAAALMATAALTHYDVSTTGYFVMLMNGQAIEGWLLFGALAYRLQQTIIRNAEEHRLATTDALTGISNRRSFDAALAREWDRCARSRSNLSVLMIDVDHFKKFNDTYGHLEGDTCLKRVAQAIRSEVQRPSDVCARYGGEEFAVILPETDDKGALMLGEAIAQAVRMQFIPHAASESTFVSVSIGCAAMIPYTGDSPQLLIRNADAALYQAKESGRDRVFVK